MHPAYSVILFTTASGAGYGLLIWVAILGSLGMLPAAPQFALSTMGVSLGLITAGLLSSTAHLGHPERAWRAFSQWRTSWLSREGVLAVLTYGPALLLGWFWGVEGKTTGFVYQMTCLAAAGLAFATVVSTGMIYACLRTIRSWNHPLTVINYIALGLASGGLLLGFLMSVFGVLALWTPSAAFLGLCVAFVCKRLYWRKIDSEDIGYTKEQALGLKGEIREIEPAHTLPNYVMQEMGYVIARKHSVFMRRLAQFLIFVVPLISLCLITLIFMPSGLQTVLFGVAVASLAPGLFVERWLFFAEAVHVVTLYYGR